MAAVYVGVLVLGFAASLVLLAAAVLGRFHRLLLAPVIAAPAYYVLASAGVPWFTGAPVAVALGLLVLGGLPGSLAALAAASVLLGPVDAGNSDMGELMYVAASAAHYEPARMLPGPALLPYSQGGVYGLLLSTLFPPDYGFAAYQRIALATAFIRGALLATIWFTGYRLRGSRLAAALVLAAASAAPISLAANPSWWISALVPVSAAAAVLTGYMYLVTGGRRWFAAGLLVLALAVNVNYAAAALAALGAAALYASARGLRATVTDRRVIVYVLSAAAAVVWLGGWATTFLAVHENRFDPSLLVPGLRHVLFTIGGPGTVALVLWLASAVAGAPRRPYYALYVAGTLVFASLFYSQIHGTTLFYVPYGLGAAAVALAPRSRRLELVLVAFAAASAVAAAAAAWNPAPGYMCRELYALHHVVAEETVGEGRLPFALEPVFGLPPVYGGVAAHGAYEYSIGDWFPAPAYTLKCVEGRLVIDPSG